MRRASIPTARSVTVASIPAALDALKTFPIPVVLKADGLAAGKGVVVAHSSAEAQAAIPQLLPPNASLLIEEFLAGEEVSFIVLSDGARFLPFEATQDHKAVHDGDTGPNTGGMGAYCDGRILSSADRARILDNVVEPALSTMRAEGTPFTGFLYAGIMMTSAGPKVLEFNARLGDPETQSSPAPHGRRFRRPSARRRRGLPRFRNVHLETRTLRLRRSRRARLPRRAPYRRRHPRHRSPRPPSSSKPARD